MKRHLPSAALIALLLLGAMPVLLFGCDGDEEPTANVEAATAEQGQGNLLTDTVTGTAKGTWKAAKRPFEDVGLVRETIPPLLIEVANAPYRKPAILTCDTLRYEIAQLDIVLGPDICVPDNPNSSTASRSEYLKEGASFAQKQAVDVASGYLDILPFRGVVRKVSGAEKHAKAVAKAYEIGKSRRAFLRGLAAQMDPECLITPSPTPL
jgi:hypothetical protein